MNSSKLTLFKGIQELKSFFNSQDFLEVTTPPMVQNPGMEVHIHPFQIIGAKDKRVTDFYLHTSPEFAMKELLSEGMERIYNISYCFRDEPRSSTHRPQFLMLEWYRANEKYEAIKKDCEKLVKEFSQTPFNKIDTVTCSELFKEYCGFDILDFLDPTDLYEKIKCDFAELSVTKELPWEDLFFILFLNKIETQFKNLPALIVDEYPAPLAALSTLKRQDPRVCERFELYLNGIEVANCFNELTDLNEQRKRFIHDGKKKESLYGYRMPEPKVLYSALETGLPSCSGIALGVERFLMAMTGEDSLFYT